MRGMLCEARSLHSISQWGRDQGIDTTLSLGFAQERTPAVSTLYRIFSQLDRERFERALGGWLQGHGLGQREAVAVDGKTLQGITARNYLEFNGWRPTPSTPASWWDSGR